MARGISVSQEVQGLALTAFGVQFSVIANSAMKTVVGVPVVQAMQLRFCIQWVFTTIFGLVMLCRGRDVHFLGRPGQRLLLLGRAVTFALAILSLWTSLRLMPVGIVTTLLYVYPLICGILASVFLSEPLGWSFWAQAAVSCVGVLLVTGMGFAQAGRQDPRGIALVLAAAFCFASTNCLVRALQEARTVEVQLFTDTVMAFVAMPCTLLLTGTGSDWSAWTARDFGHLAAATAAGLTALLIVIRGHQLAPASKATLFTYLEVPSAFVVQALVFGQLPAGRELFGAGLVVLAAFCRIWHEASAGGVKQVDKAALLAPGPRAGEEPGAGA